MRLSISSDGRYSQTPDGSIWTDGALHYGVWSRYLSAFERVNVVARVAPIDAASEKLRRADGDGVSFSPIPSYLGPVQYLLKSAAVKRAAHAAIAPGDAVMLNVPGQVANCVHATLAADRPYAVHVISDPYDTFAPGAFKHPLRAFFRRYFSGKLRTQVADAAAALFVTRSTLQERYAGRGLRAGISDVDLPPAAFVPTARRYDEPSRSFTLMNIGTMSTQFTKGLDVLIEAVGICVKRGLDLRLILVGGGRYQPFLEGLAARFGVTERVVFRGQLPAGEAVRRELDRADLFAFPSRIEGLPRALVEAMARALPCISTPVGGIPELLPAADLVPVGDAAALAEKIAAVMADPARLAAMSAANLQVAHGFQAELLRVEWDAFFQELAAQTQEWNTAHGLSMTVAARSERVEEMPAGV